MKKRELRKQIAELELDNATLRKVREAWKEQWEAALLESESTREKLQAEVERLKDCHPADGVSFCGACITCLNRELDNGQAAPTPDTGLP